MEKKKISALLAAELVSRSPKLKPLYVNAEGKVDFDSKDSVSVAEVLMKTPAFFKPNVFIESVKTLSDKIKTASFCSLALKFFQQNLSFEKIIAYYAGETKVILSLEDFMIEEFFCKMSGCKKTDLKKSVADTVISRPLLIDMVDALEYLTGRPLISENNQPLAYLDESATYRDIAQYFSTGSEKINAVRALVLKALPPTTEQLIFRFRTKAAVIYAQQVGYEKIDEDFLKLKVKQLHPVEFGPEEWDLAIAWTEDELNIQVFHLLGERISDESTVRDLLDLFCEAYQKK